jgi:CheY-like chemotaxis protein
MSRTAVLCAVDDRDLAGIFEKALSGEGFHVTLVHDGKQALEAYRSTDPDVVVADVTLAKLDGFELLEGIRTAESPSGHTPVVLLSDNRISPQYQQRANRLGADLILAKPVPLDSFLPQVVRLAKPGPPSATRKRAGRSSEAAQGKRGQKPLAGSFKELPFPQLLHHLHGLRASGVLMLTNGRKRKAIQLRDGYPVSVQSNLVNECLGSHLKRVGKLSDKEYRTSLDRLKAGEGLLGEILVAMHLLDEEEVATALRHHAREKLFEIFEWQQGKFSLEIGTRLQRGSEFSVDSSPANVILEGIRSRYPLEAVDRFLHANRKRYPSPAESPFYRFQEIDLSDEERKLLDQFDGEHALGELAESRERLRRAAFGLLVTGLLELSEKGKDASMTRRIAPGKPSVDSSARMDTALRIELTALAARMRGQNHYDLLGVPRICTLDKLESAHEKLAKRVHPDRFQNTGKSVRQLAEELAGLVTEAYETLREPRSRKTYDLELLKGVREAAREQEGRKALDAETEFQKGQVLLRQRNYESALVCFGTALQHNSEDGEYHAHYGWCLYLCHQDESSILAEAIEHVTRGVKLARDREKPYLFLGRLYKVAGKVPAAEKMFMRAVQIQPECVEALRELRLINLRREKSKGLIGRLLRR